MTSKKSLDRKPKNVEFLQTLYELSGLTKKEFARSCGKAPSHMTNWLNGKFTPSDAVLKQIIVHRFEWAISPLQEVRPIPRNFSELPDAPGVYAIYDSAGNVLYVGQATNLRVEVRNTLRRTVPVAIRVGPKLRKSNPTIKSIATHVSLYQVDSARARHNLEALMLRVLPNQTHNSNVGHFR